MAIAVAAAAAAVHPSPPPPARRTMAWLACTHLAWTAIVCLLIPSVWLFFWGWATFEIGRFACGDGCAVVNAACKVAYVAGVTFGVTLVLVLSFSEVALKMARAKVAAVVPVVAAATDVEATKTKEPALKTSDWATRVRDFLRDPITLGLLASLAFVLLMVIALLAMGDSAVMGSRRQRMCSVIYSVGSLGMHSVNCFFLCPLITVRIWRTWRKVQRAL